MKEKDLKKLNRYQLLELLIMQTERADKLQSKLETAEKLLTARELKMATLGSLAEASLEISGVIQAAQEAADRYLAAAQKAARKLEADAREHAAQIEAEAREKAADIESDANRRAAVIIAQAQWDKGNNGL